MGLMHALDMMKGGEHGGDHTGDYDPMDMFKDYMDPERLNQELLDAIPVFVEGLMDRL
jgi:hypothetical protein